MRSFTARRWGSVPNLLYLLLPCLLAAALSSSASAAAPYSSCERAPGDSDRIAVAGGSLVEILYLLGEERRIIAVDTTSNHPPAARTFPSIGYVRNLSAEGVLSLAPNILLGEDDMGPPVVLGQISVSGVPVVRVSETHTAEGILEKIRCVAAILGVPAAAERVIASELTPRLRRLETRVSETESRRLRIGVLLSVREGAPIAAGTRTSGNGLIRMLRAENVFAEIEGWKPVSFEAMVGAAPDYLLVTDRGAAQAGGLEALRKHPAIRLTPAAREGGILVMDGMAMLGYGPRTFETALELLAAMDRAP